MLNKKFKLYGQPKILSAPTKPIIAIGIQH